MPRDRRGPAGVRIREVHTARDPAFRAAYRMVRRVFAVSEVLSSRDWVYTMRERAAGLWTDLDWHLVVAERGGKPVGAASGSYLGNLNVGVVGYVAVAPSLRSHGIGPRLRRRLRALFERDARRVRRRPLEAIVGEVKRDNPWLRHLVAREGAIALDFPYYQPALDAGGREVALVLYYQPLTRRRQSLRADQVRRLLYTLYRRAYRVPRPLALPVFRRMLRSLAGRGTIGRRSRRVGAPPGP